MHLQNMESQSYQGIEGGGRERLNLTNTYLSSNVEMVQDFQRRRIKWAIVTSDETDLSWWKVAKKAGIGDEDWKELEKYYLRVIEK
jgi:hypothetical protein